MTTEYSAEQHQSLPEHMIPATDVGVRFSWGQLKSLDVKYSEQQRRVYEENFNNILLDSDEMWGVDTTGISAEELDEFEVRFLFNLSEAPIAGLTFSESNKETAVIFRIEGGDNPIYPEIPISHLPKVAVPVRIDKKWSQVELGSYRTEAKESKKRQQNGETIAASLRFLTKLGQDWYTGEAAHAKALEYAQALEDALSNYPDIEWRVALDISIDDSSDQINDLDGEDDEARLKELFQKQSQLIDRDTEREEFVLVGVQFEIESLDPEVMLIVRDISTEMTAVKLPPAALPKSLTVYAAGHEETYRTRTLNPVDAEIQ